MARYLVTGGAGFIGSNIAEALVKRGEEVVVLDNLATGYEKNIAHLRGDLTFIKGDVRDAETVREALAGVDYVLHQAALASVPRSIEDPVLVTDVNVRGTLVTLDEARRAGVKRFVYAASSSAYGDTETLPKVERMTPKPLSPYAASKLMGEYYCSVYAHVYGMSTVALRYFNIFGPRQDPRASTRRSFRSSFPICSRRRRRASTATASRAGISRTSRTSSRRIFWRLAANGRGDRRSTSRAARATR
jgi:nucleoside-diphosphate-sugar epimerase